MSDKNKTVQIKSGDKDKNKTDASKEKTPKDGKGIEKDNKKSAIGKGNSETKAKPCPWTGGMVPTNVPGPGQAQTVLHPRKDVFVLKVAKVGPNGDRRCKMELELVTPKGFEKKLPSRVDTREAQCDPDPPPCCCTRKKKKY